MNEHWEPSPGGTPIDFWIDVEPQRDAVKLIPAGELDIATVGQLQSELDDLIEAGFARVVIDLCGVEFIDSTGLHLLVSAHERARARSGSSAIVSGRHAVQQLFEITGTIEQLNSRPPLTAPATPTVATRNSRTDRMTSSSPPERGAGPLPIRPYTQTHSDGNADLAGPTPRYPIARTASRRGHPTLPNTPKGETLTGLLWS